MIMVGRNVLDIRVSLVLSVLALALGGGIPVSGQESPNTVAASRDAAAADEDNNDLPQADVVIDGNTLFGVRGVRTHPAERRAEEIENRIVAVARNSKIDANSLTLQDHPEGTWIMADGQRILAVLNEDASIEEISPHPLAEIYRSHIGEAIEEYRRDRRPGFERRARPRCAGGNTCATRCIAIWPQDCRLVAGRIRAALSGAY